jgi:rhodanese-related sulfurtransferase
VALLLKRRGITRIRPLAGGLEGWRERGLPLESLSLVPVAEDER